MNAAPDILLGLSPLGKPLDQLFIGLGRLVYSHQPDLRRLRQ